MARKVASLTRAVPLAVIDLVDRAVAAIIGTESPTRVLTVAQAKIMEADPVGTAEKAEAERRRRYVALSRADEHGLRHVIARVTAGDAHWVDVMVDRVADLIAADHPEAIADELRSIAFGWLARPRTSCSFFRPSPRPAGAAATRRSCTCTCTRPPRPVWSQESPASMDSARSLSTGCATWSGTPTSR